jgi:hypothetical protein
MGNPRATDGKLLESRTLPGRNTYGGIVKQRITEIQEVDTLTKAIGPR